MFFVLHSIAIIGSGLFYTSMFRYILNSTLHGRGHKKLRGARLRSSSKWTAGSTLISHSHLHSEVAIQLVEIPEIPRAVMSVARKMRIETPCKQIS